jgi:hypothetical protein
LIWTARIFPAVKASVEISIFIFPHHLLSSRDLLSPIVCLFYRRKENEEARKISLAAAQSKTQTIICKTVKFVSPKDSWKSIFRIRSWGLNLFQCNVKWKMASQKYFFKNSRFTLKKKQARSRERSKILQLKHYDVIFNIDFQRF